EGGQIAERDMKALGSKEGLVSALVQQREPLNHCDGEQPLTPQPYRPVRLHGEVESEPRERAALESDPRAGAVSRAKVDELGGSWCGAMSHRSSLQARVCCPVRRPMLAPAGQRGVIWRSTMISGGRQLARGTPIRHSN